MQQDYLKCVIVLFIFFSQEYQFVDEVFLIRRFYYFFNSSVFYCFYLNRTILVKYIYCYYIEILNFITFNNVYYFLLIQNCRKTNVIIVIHLILMAKSKHPENKQYVAFSFINICKYELKIGLSLDVNVIPQIHFQVR